MACRSSVRRCWVSLLSRGTEIRESDPARRPGVERPLLPRVTWCLAASCLRAAYHLEAVGRERIPRWGPCVFVANHTSHLDIFALVSQLPRKRRATARPLAAADFFVGMTSFSLALNDDEAQWHRKLEELKSQIPAYDWAGVAQTKKSVKDQYATALNYVLPTFDLVVIDEAHNFKHNFEWII